MSLPNEASEALHFWRLRATLLRAIVSQTLQEQRLRTALILFLTLVFWGVMYLLFEDGFQLIRTMVSHEGTRVQIAHAVFNVFFLALFVMLTVSAGIILYSGLYRSREAQFLITLPTRAARIALYKFQETVFVACWGFFLLGSPLLIAYGRVADAPWYYYLMLPWFMVAFVALPCGLGALFCLALVRYAPQYRRLLVFALGALAIVGGTLVAFWMVREANPQNMMSLEWFQSMLTRLKYSERRFLPSWWLSTGLLEAAHPASANGQHSAFESVMFLSVLASNAIAVFWTVGLVAERIYIAGHSAIAGAGHSRRSKQESLLDRGLSLALSVFSPRIRHMLLKDFRIFRRDTMQWSQLAIFTTLLVFYFLNIRRLHQANSNGTWLIMISYLNVAVVALLLATFTTRFIFPLISLEGPRFWVLGTLPMSRRTVLFSKFFFAAAISVLPCSLLILLSDFMLGLFQDHALLAFMHQVTMLFMCLGLCGIATGLGARFPNLKEASPAKIASGFGGTLTLVLSATLILTTTLLTAIPAFCWLRSAANGVVPSWYHASMFPVGFGLAVGLGCMATWLPLRSGQNAFDALEV